MPHQRQQENPVRLGNVESLFPLGEAVPSGRGLGVGAAVPPATHMHENSPATGRGCSGRRLLVCLHQFPNIGFDVAKLVRHILAAGLDFVLKVGQTGIDAAFRRVYPLLQPLEAPRDGHGNIVAVLVNHALNQLDVFLLQ